MKKTLIILSAMLCIGIHGTQAQNVLDILKKISNTNTEKQESANSGTTTATKETALSGIGDFLAGILGKDKVSPASLTGTWTYKQPAIIFGSDNLLTNVGTMAAGKAAEAKLQKSLDKIGFTAGKVKMNFKEDGSGIVTYTNKDIPFQWSVEGSEITMQLGSGVLNKLASSDKLGKYSSFKLNCKMGLNTMQLAFKADKLMEFLNKVVSATGKATNNSTISSIAGLANKVDDMYLGLTLEK
ncbi:MAG: DUF4923 family protein [Paraprevotella sp.]|nr:DUF4923 family protein [Paraprevotella sp.]